MEAMKGMEERLETIGQGNAFEKSLLNKVFQIFNLWFDLNFLQSPASSL